MKASPNSYNTNFQAGLTSKMRQEIKLCDVKKISNEFERNGIQTDFKESKPVAWCCLKVLEIVKKLNLGLPKGVFVEDFDNLHIENDSLGFCNFQPTLLHKNKDDVTEGNTLFFNDINWEVIDIIADESYEHGISSTNFFLETFIHEFAHSMHDNNLLNKFSRINLLQKIFETKEEKQNQKFHKKFDFILSQICMYAFSTPFEAVACDLSKRIIQNLNKNNLTINSDFIPNSPYRKSKMFDFKTSEDKLSKTIKNFWNGKFS